MLDTRISKGARVRNLAIHMHANLVNYRNGLTLNEKAYGSIVLICSNFSAITRKTRIYN